MNTASLGLARIGQIAITVQNLERATAFYRDILGLRFLFQVPNMAFFDCDGVRLLLGLAEKNDPLRRSSVLYFTVPGIQAAHELLRTRGVTIVSPPHLVAPMKDHDLWMAFFQDSEENTLALMSEVRRG
jgi:methylmalonyl-CoA/ethylmalonyl-CoA epimerase